MYFNSQRQEAISPIYPRSSQRCRGLSAGNKEIREVMQSLTLPAYHMSSSSSSLSPPPTKSCHKEHPIWDTFLVTNWSTTKFVKKKSVSLCKKVLLINQTLDLDQWPCQPAPLSKPQGVCRCAGVQVCRCTQIEEISKDHPFYWHSQQGRCVCYDRNRIVWSQFKTKRWTATKRNWTTASFHPLCGNFSKEARQSFLFVNVLIQLGVFLLLLQSQLSLVCHREVWLLVHLYTDSAYPLLNLKVLLLPLSICTDTTLTSLQSCRIICCCNAN